jgi:glycine betaine/proline transport system substrate-binding protein
MMKTISFLTIISIFLTSCFGGSDENKTANSNCGDIKIAEMTWASAQLMANIDKIVLGEGYGCSASIVPGDTNPTFASMNTKGVPDIAPEMWINAVREPLKKAVAAGKINIANDAPITGLGEGWWLDPTTAKKHPELKTVLDVLKHPEIFPDKEDPSKGAFHTCPAGWGCQIANANLFKGFEMETKGWKAINPGSGAGLDGSIAKAVGQGKPWFGYYWAPTAIIGKYNLVPLDFGVPYVGDEHWNNCITKSDCVSPKASSWTESAVNTITSKTFNDSANDEIKTYLKNRVLPSSAVNAMLVYMDDNQASGADAALEFFIKYPELWQSWVSPEVADKIKTSLK